MGTAAPPRAGARRVWVCLAASIAFHGAALGVLGRVSRPRVTTPIEVVMLERIAPPPPVPVPEPVPAPASGPAAPAAASRRAAARPAGDRGGTSPRGGAGGLEKKGVLGALAALRPLGGDEVLGKQAMGDVAAAVESAGTLPVAGDAAAMSGKKGVGGSGEAATIGGLGTSGGGAGRLGAGSSGEPGGPVGRVGSGDVGTDGGELDRSRLVSFVRARMGGIRACYEAQLRRDPALRGRIRISFTVLETGNLAEVVAVEDTLGSAEVTRCVVGMMRTWHLPLQPSAPVLVDYPLVFSPREG